MFQRRNTDISKASTVNIVNLEGADIFNAINTNDSQKIKLFLNNQNHKIWKVKDENGYTALHRLVFINNYEFPFIRNLIRHAFSQIANHLFYQFFHVTITHNSLFYFKY